jgi:hypothetical protein
MDKGANKFTIPELDLSFRIANPALTALYLLPFYDRHYIEIDDDPQVEKLNKDKIIEAMELISDMDVAELNYIVLIGRNAHNALKLLKKKYEHLIADDNKFSVITRPNEIHVPIKLGKALSEDSMLLSELLSLSGVSVVNYDDTRSMVYSQGREIFMSFTDAPGYLRFVGSLGFYIDEYLFGEFFLKVKNEREEIFELLLENLNTAFVRSLSSLFTGNHRHYQKSMKSILKGNSNYDITRLFKIIDSLGFDYIKNMEYDFVSLLLYEEE